MKDINGAFVRGAETCRKFLEVVIDGHGRVVEDYLENVGTCTEHPGANAYSSSLRQRSGGRHFPWRLACRFRLCQAKQGDW